MTEPVSSGQPYLLTPDDFAAFASLLQAQNALGPATTTPGQADFWTFYDAIHAFGYNRYQRITNDVLRSWVDRLYQPMINTRTVYGISAAGMYAVHVYARYVADGGGRDDDKFNGSGYPVDWQTLGGRFPNWSQPCPPFTVPWIDFVCNWMPPGGSPALLRSIDGDFGTLEDGFSKRPPVFTAITWLAYDRGTMPDYAALVAFEESRFDPKNWTDSTVFVQNLHGSGLWTAQSQTTTALLQQNTLTGEAYTFLLLLLMAHGTSTAAERQRAQRIVSTLAPSREHPNETFANQLVYLVLMYLADPDGPFGDSHADLMERLGLWISWVTNGDPASQAIRASLVHHQRILRSDAAYPMQDPDVGTGFTQRKTDTLFALDRARHSLSS